MEIMKKLIALLLILCMSSCTDIFYADTAVLCPCKVSGIQKVSGAEKYIIQVSSTKNVEHYFSFYTTTPYYQIGDTIP